MTGKKGGVWVEFNSYLFNYPTLFNIKYPETMLSLYTMSLKPIQFVTSVPQNDCLIGKCDSFVSNAIYTRFTKQKNSSKLDYANLNHICKNYENLYCWGTFPLIILAEVWMVQKPTEKQHICVTNINLTHPKSVILEILKTLLKKTASMVFKLHYW